MLIYSNMSKTKTQKQSFEQLIQALIAQQGSERAAAAVIDIHYCRVHRYKSDAQIINDTLALAERLRCSLNPRPSRQDFYRF